ncbi:FecCD family ABC transporter permease [Streptomyces abyssomicinicus]|uniref:FecCD family ABC transporter permease n=1 Tax=Streptomyces abyssomicinicus TaxID=574929 RepID=UPI00124F87DD|nr:iron ABC transporter permease [Streptomyces abyssomicinicus]
MTNVLTRALPAVPRRGRPSRSLIIGAGLVVSLLSVALSVVVGTAGIGLGDVFHTIAIHLFGVPSTDSFRRTEVIVTELRLPRALLAFLAGAALSVSGVVMQGLLRNPLVSPYTLGLSPAASFGAALAIMLSNKAGNTPSSLVTILSALGFSLVVSLIVLGVASMKRMKAVTLLLVGMAFFQLFEALTSATQFFADENTLAEIVHWTFGSVNDATWHQVLVVSVLLAVTLPYLFARAKALNAIAFAGDDAAASLGVNVSRTRLVLIVVVVVLTAVVVSFTGVIGFVGLVGPHIARLVVGSDHRYLLPFGAIAGGLLILYADVVGRAVLSPVVIPVGIVVALIGAPLFINLVLSKGTLAQS